MKVEKVREFIKDLTSVLRDLKLGLCLDSSILQTKSPLKFYDRVTHYRFHKKLKEIMDLNGVICGTSALKFYYLNNVPLILDDCEWSTILSVNNFNTFYEDYPISVLQKSSYIPNGIKIGDKYLFNRVLNVNFGEVPRYNIFGKYKIETLESILYRNLEVIKSETMHLIDSSDYKSDELNDSVEVTVKLLAYYGDFTQAALSSLYEVNIDRMIKLLGAIEKFC